MRVILTEQYWHPFWFCWRYRQEIRLLILCSKKLKNKQKHWTFLQAWVGMLSFAFHLLESRKQEEAALIKKRRVGKLLHSEERVFVCSSFLPIHTNFIGLHDTA